MTNLQRRAVAACAIAVALAGLAYVNALHNPFIYDDHRLIVENRALQHPGDFRAVIWHDVTRPVIALTYALDRRLSGGSLLGYHLTNVLLHMINVWLFAWLAWRACQDWRLRAPAAASAARPEIVAPIAAVLLAVHPMMTEAVGYISGRSEVLCATFFLLGLHAARIAIVSGRRRWVLPAFVCWIAALGSKESAVLFPVLVWLYDRWIVDGARGGLKDRMRWIHLPLIGIAISLAIVRLLIFVSAEHGPAVSIQWGLIGVELDVIRRYLTMLLVPAGQAIFHAVPPAGAGSARLWAAAAVIAGLVAVAWRSRRSRPLAGFGIAWFLLLLVPSSVLVFFDRGELMAEHRVYLAAMGAFLVAALLIDRGIAWLGARRMSAGLVFTAVFLAIALSLGGRTLLRNQVWADPLAVWLEAAEEAPDSWFPPLMLGEELHRRGLHDRAVAAFRRSIAARPQESAAYGKLGLCLAELHDLAGADAAFTKERGLDPLSAEASNGLATVALLRGDLGAARRGYLETLTLDRENIAARRGLAGIEEAGGNAAEALRWCEDIRRLAPETPGNDECIRRNQARLAGR